MANETYNLYGRSWSEWGKVASIYIPLMALVAVGIGETFHSFISESEDTHVPLEEALIAGSGVAVVALFVALAEYWSPGPTDDPE